MRRRAFGQRWLVALALTFLVHGAAAGPLLSAEQGTTASKEGNGSWSARSSTGRTFGGTWTVRLDAAGDAVGTWTLLDGGGRMLASGGWSAVKSDAGWDGRWRAAVDGRRGEFAGTWTADLDLPPGSSFARLFEKTADAVVNGAWRAGRQSGTWAIRVSN